MTFTVKHVKHPKLARRTYATFSPVDIGVFGAPCGEIAQLCSALAGQLKDKRVLYVDAEHTAFDNAEHSNVRADGFEAELIDHQMGWNVQRRKPPVVLEDEKSQQWFDSGDEFDLALVNANHFLTSVTVLYWHPSKLKSVLKREEHCRNCQLVLSDDADAIPEEVVNLLPENVAYTSPSDIGSILQLIRSLSATPKLKSIVLAGGKSTRMGEDKTKLALHGQPQYQHMLEVATSVTSEGYISARAEQDFTSNASVITDRFVGLGPFGAILSAFMHDPNAAWLVIAADLPMIDPSFLSELIEARDPSKVSTAFLNPVTGFADPLCTIYEPRAYPRLLHFLSRGVSCPRKMLINSDVKLIEPSNAEKLFNLNTPEDLERFRSLK
jgi:molybdopterin-guanine dinucleotide biosynthesis protein A